MVLNYTDRLDLTRPDLSETFYYLEKKEIPIVIHSGDAPLPGTLYKY
ncbi:hypothetical protein ACLK29_15930 [Leptospira kirschneri]